MGHFYLHFTTVWENHIEFQTPGFGVAQAKLLGPLMEQVNRWMISALLPESSHSLFF